MEAAVASSKSLPCTSYAMVHACSPRRIRACAWRYCVAGLPLDAVPGPRSVPPSASSAPRASFPFASSSIVGLLPSAGPAPRTENYWWRWARRSYGHADIRLPSPVTSSIARLRESCLCLAPLRACYLCRRSTPVPSPCVRTVAPADSLLYSTRSIDVLLYSFFCTVRT